MTVEFCTIHNNSSLFENSKACVLQFFTDEKLTEIDINCGILVWSTITPS